jgi:hypothetical protein
MRRLIPSVLLASALCAASARGQIDVRCTIAYPRVLQFEPIVATLRIDNHMGEPIELSGSGPDARVSFDVEESPGVLVEPSDVPVLPKPVRIQPQDAAEAKVNLLSAYRISHAGPYTITARVRWGGKVFISPRVFLDVLPGLEIEKMVSGMPGGQGMRTYTLRTLSRDRSERVFLRIEDEDRNTCYGVYDLGRIVRLFKPRLAVDGLGHIHVLHQSGPWQYTHTEFTADGRPVNQELYSSQGATVRMDRGEDGVVSVDGAEPIRTDGSEEEDVPEEAPAVEPKAESHPIAR